MTEADPHSLDLRVWIDDMRARGELTDVSGADRDLELGAISELNVKKDKPNALLFDDIPGFAKGHRVITCTTSSPLRLSSLLRLDETRTHRDLVQALRGKPKFWQSRAGDFNPVYVETGPVFDNVRQGDDVDIGIFPAPLWHEKDGGRYIGTGCMVVTKDFDSDWVNVGTYRVMSHDARHVGLDMIPGKHGAIQYE